ncbi:alpha-1,2-fucosyltransferase [Polynucleobacter sp. MWH-Braz-FAM2G]|uniref:alpha-1,2-fucosyltransferase n=1 Tax=Polynucleobacter sp. MWH-Braz-FAM2G TaxID=1855883 RepID=UPI001BFD936A|nr:alpha-1,2-fucosyltransferase [Polynucleobacter sp. MWH-Braz-FAM2G]QWD91100.1 alpha-1,2-fucosyltransferase [Polynucleobacter sp. MWH-Braz-FAM2G]
MSDSEYGVIVVRIVGGLGNQMFQYACGRAAAIRSRRQLLLDISAFDRYKTHQYGLDGFRIIAQIASRKLQTDSRLRASLRHLGLSTKMQMNLQGFHYLKEAEDLAFQSSMPGNCIKTYLDGYWQNEAYFADSSNIIRAEFQLRRAGAAPDVRAIAGDDLPLVSLHIRRGNYVNDPKANAVHGVLDLGYYLDAIALLTKRIGEGFHIVVFSDDIEWVRQKLVCKQPLSFVSGSTAVPHEDLHLMASCDHHIIANSSFSWWGAWLNPSPKKMVIAPKNWFVSPKFSHQYICPSSWVQI